MKYFIYLLFIFTGVLNACTPDFWEYDRELAKEYKKLEDFILQNIKIDKEILKLSDSMVKLDSQKAVNNSAWNFIQDQKNILEVKKSEQ